MPYFNFVKYNALGLLELRSNPTGEVQQFPAARTIRNRFLEGKPRDKDCNAVFSRLDDFFFRDFVLKICLGCLKFPTEAFPPE